TATLRRPVLLTNIAAILVGVGMMAQAIVIPQLLEMPAVTGYGLGQNLLQTGLWMAPGGLMMMAMAPVSSRIIRMFGAKIALAIGPRIEYGVSYRPVHDGRAMAITDRHDSRVIGRRYRICRHANPDFGKYSRTRIGFGRVHQYVGSFDRHDPCRCTDGHPAD